MGALDDDLAQNLYSSEILLAAGVLYSSVNRYSFSALVDLFANLLSNKAKVLYFAMLSHPGRIYTSPVTMKPVGGRDWFTELCEINNLTVSEINLSTVQEHFEYQRSEVRGYGSPLLFAVRH